MLDTTRMRRFVLGAALGALAAFASLAAGFPVVTSHSLMTLVAGMAIGVLAATAPTHIVAPVIGAITLFISLVTLTPVMRAPVVSWIRRDSIPTARLDAVVVLSSSVSADSVIDPIATERLLSGLELARRLNVGVIVTTRPAVSKHDLRPVSDADERALVSLGGDTTRWREVGPVRTTREEATATAALLAPARDRTIAVVTSPLHTRRACAAFEAVGFRVACVPSTERMYAIYSFNGVRGRLMALTDWLYERLATIEYRARGWVR